MTDIRSTLMNDILPDDMMTEFRSRAGGYDEQNRFFDEDLADLRESGYLGLFSSEDDGGKGCSLQEVAALQRRLAAAAPATALGINMHLVWAGVAHVLQARGDDSLSFILREAVGGELFAFGLSEPGNDAGLFDSLTKAVPRADGSMEYTGTKVFTSLSPAWTRLGTVGKDTSGSSPELVYGFLTRDAPGVTIKDDWNTLGMRASQSNTTVLDSAAVSPDRVVRRLPVGPSADPLIFAIFAVFETLLASVYTGIADRAMELAVEAAHARTSFKNDGRSSAHDPDIRRRVAAAALQLDTAVARLQQTARDVDLLVDHGPRWFGLLSGVKVECTRTARSVVDMAQQVCGGRGYFRGQEIERLYRDVVAGGFHPSSEDSALATIANAWLGPLPQ